MKKFIGLMIAILLTGCKEYSDKPASSKMSVVDSITSEYPDEVKRLHVEHLYDKTKWYIYCSCVDRKVHFRSDANVDTPEITYSMLSLHFERIETYADTISIKFFFTYQGKVLDGQTVLNEPGWGCIYIGESDKIREIESRKTYNSGIICEDSTNCPDLFDDINMNKVKEYIRSHKTALDPWFRKESIRRGVIKE